MSDKYFVDTNILVYAHDSLAGAKYDRAKALIDELWLSHSGVLSTQVLQELCVNLRRKMHRPLDQQTTRDIIADYVQWELVVNSGESVLKAMEIESEYGMSFWDALIICSAELSNAAVLYSEDFSHGQLYRSVRVVNPFL